MSDAAYFRKQATKCRQLARASQEREARILDDMAAEYAAKAIELDLQTRH
jgi:hypothetical protein